MKYILVNGVDQMHHRFLGWTFDNASVYDTKENAQKTMLFLIKEGIENINPSIHIEEIDNELADLYRAETANILKRNPGVERFFNFGKSNLSASEFKRERELALTKLV